MEHGLHITEEELCSLSMAAAWAWIEKAWVDNKNYTLFAWRAGLEVATRHVLNDRRQDIFIIIVITLPLSVFLFPLFVRSFYS